MNSLPIARELYKKWCEYRKKYPFADTMFYLKELHKDTLLDVEVIKELLLVYIYNCD